MSNEEVKIRLPVRLKDCPCSGCGKEHHSMEMANIKATARVSLYSYPNTLYSECLAH